MSIQFSFFRLLSSERVKKMTKRKNENFLIRRWDASMMKSGAYFLRQNDEHQPQPNRIYYAQAHTQPLGICAVDIENTYSFTSRKGEFRVHHSYLCRPDNPVFLLFSMHRFFSTLYIVVVVFESCIIWWAIFSYDALSLLMWLGYKNSLANSIFFLSLSGVHEILFIDD